MIIKSILTEIFQKHSDLHIATFQHYNVERLLDKITCINNEQFLVMAEWDIADVIPNAGDVDVDVKGYIVFYYIIHDDYFYLERMKNEDAVKEFLLEVSGNYFFKDITVFLDGKIKKYIINHVDDRAFVTWMD